MKLAIVSKKRRLKQKVRADQMPDIFARVYARRGARSLARIASVFGLNKSETGRLFGISRQAIDEWFGKGVPMNRLADVGRIASLAAAFNRQFKPERVPQIVRSKMPGLENDSVLDAIPKRGTVPVLEMLDRAFSYIPRS